MNRGFWSAAFCSWVFTFLLLSCSNGASDASDGALSAEDERQKKIEEAVPAGASDELYLRTGAEIDMGTLIERIERHLNEKNLFDKFQPEVRIQRHHRFRHEFQRLVPCKTLD